MEPRDARSTRAYRRLRDYVRSLRLPCSVCGLPIDYSIKGDANRKHPMGYTLEHTTALANGGAALDPTNVSAAHRSCNARKGARTIKHVPGQSRRW